mmetsp:Transcript_16166/g.37061  ORF Transcript_16166/g.37061 Transcript_16166/m.37061 type:complete len:184 (-) Transcript_16166:2-553(-)
MELTKKKNIRRRPTSKRLDCTASGGSGSGNGQPRCSGGGKDPSSKRRMLHRISSTNKWILDSRQQHGLTAAKITDLNNKAVQLYIRGDFRSASRCFEEATFLRINEFDSSSLSSSSWMYQLSSYPKPTPIIPTIQPLAAMVPKENPQTPSYGSFHNVSDNNKNNSNKKKNNNNNNNGGSEASS